MPCAGARSGRGGARARSTRWHASGLPARGELRLFYIALTAIAKRYLERRLGAPVLEMTSSEMLAFLRGAPRTARELPAASCATWPRRRTRSSSRKGQGLVAEAERHLAAVRALVPALEAKLAPKPVAEAEGKAA